MNNKTSSQQIQKSIIKIPGSLIIFINPDLIYLSI